MGEYEIAKDLIALQAQISELNDRVEYLYSVMVEKKLIEEKKGK